MSWSAAAFNLLVLGLVIGIFWTLDPTPRSSVIGAAVFLIYSHGSRFLLTRSHRRGIHLVRQGRYDEAIPQFEKSLAFFTQHSWLDQYRALTLLSPSAMSYREMALCNLGFSYSQLGQGAKAKEMYRSVAADYPNNAIAPTALRMIESGEQISTASRNSEITR